MKPISRFQRGSGVYICRSCGKRTRATGWGEGVNVRLCESCYEEAGWENLHSDEGHKKHPSKDCPICKRDKLIRGNPLYQNFHGNPPRNVRQVEFHELKPGDRLVKLGRLLEVVYLPEGATQHKGIAYSHKFPDWGDGRKGGERPVLAVSQDGRQLFVINDRAKPKVGRRGIVG